MTELSLVPVVNETKKEKAARVSREWYAKNHEKVAARTAAYRKEHLDLYRLASHNWDKAHRERVRAIRLKSNTKHRERIRARDLARRQQPGSRAHLYGMSLEAFDVLLQSQSGRCGICRVELTLGGAKAMTRATIDHDHASHRVRGILCSPCNVGIGNLRDDSERLLAAAAYLKAHS